MNISSEKQPDSHEWIERTLSTGVKLCVQSLVTLRVGNGESFMFTVPIEDVRQVTVGPRLSSDMASAYNNKDYPWNVDVSYGGAHFAFICGPDDLAAVRYIFAGRPIVDMAARLDLPPAL